MSNCIILNYHSIIDPTVEENHYDPINSIQMDVFIKHLQIIKASGIRVLSIEELFNQDLLDENYLSITFDDGHSSDCHTVYPLLKKFDLKGSFFVTVKNVPADSPRWDLYREMSLQGHYIGTHGITHRYLSDLTFAEQLYELDESKRNIEKQIGPQKHYFSLPGGKYNAATIKIAESLGFCALLTTNFGIEQINKTPFLINRCSIKSNYSLKKIEKLLTFNSHFIKKSAFVSKTKKFAQRIIGNELSDIINYTYRA